MANPTTTVKTKRSFNRYDALLDQLQRLKESKFQLIQTSSLEMHKLRSFIQVLEMIDERQTHSSNDSNPNVVHDIRTYISELEHRLSSNLADGDGGALSKSVEYYATMNQDYASFMEIKEEIKQLRESKLRLIESVSLELNGMRETIKTLMQRIANKTARGSDPSSASVPRHRQLQASDTLLHQYGKLGTDDVVNVVMFGTECSGKSTLLQQMVHLYGSEQCVRDTFDNSQYAIINAIVQSIHNVLSEHQFFHAGDDDEKSAWSLGERMQNGISYFQSHRLCQYHAPFLSAAIVKHIKCIFANETHNDTDDGVDDARVRAIFRNHVLYRNMYRFYECIDRFSVANWHLNDPVELREQLLLVWERNASPFYYRDLKLDPTQETVFRVWDIASEVLRDADSKFANNLKHLFQCIDAALIVFVTAPDFRHKGALVTPIQKSMVYFKALLEQSPVPNTDVGVNGTGGSVLNIAQTEWSLTPIITLFNKCELFKTDMDTLALVESQDILRSFPHYDDVLSYDAVMKYLKTIFGSFNVNRKRPLHLYETSVIEEAKVRSIVHHIVTMTDLYTVNKRILKQ